MVNEALTGPHCGATPVKSGGKNLYGLAVAAYGSLTVFSEGKRTVQRNADGRAGIQYFHSVL